MKMVSRNISLPEPMAAYVESEVAREYGNTSEFFRDMVRERQRRQIDSEVAFLKSATDGAPEGPGADDIAAVLKIQRRVRKGLRARRA